MNGSFGHTDFFRGAVWVKALLVEFGAVHWTLKLQGLLFFCEMLKKCLTLRKLCDTMEVPLEFLFFSHSVIPLNVGGWHSRRLHEERKCLSANDFVDYFGAIPMFFAKSGGIGFVLPTQNYF